MRSSWHKEELLLYTVRTLDDLLGFAEQAYEAGFPAGAFPVLEDQMGRITAYLQREQLEYRCVPFEAIRADGTSTARDNVEKLLLDYDDRTKARAIPAEPYCIWVDDSGWPPEAVLYAFLYAIHFNKRIIRVRNVDEINAIGFGEPCSLFIILPWYAFHGGVPYQIHGELTKGFLPLTNASTLSLYLIKRAAIEVKLRGNNRLLSVIANRIKQKGDEEIRSGSDDQRETVYLPRDRCGSDSLSLIYRQPELLAFNYISHSRECAIMMNDFLFCGVQEQPDIGMACANTREYGHPPRCLADAGQCCVPNRARFTAEQLYAKHLFLNGCNLGDGSRSFIPYVHTIARNLIEGHAVTIITTPSIKIGDVSENVLAHNLTQYGYSVGGAARLLNAYNQNAGLENNQYYVMGDPDFTIGNLPVKRTEVRLEADGDYEVSLSGMAGLTYAEIDLIGPKARCAQTELKQLYSMDGGGEVFAVDRGYYAMLDSHEGVKLILFSNRPFVHDRLIVSLTAAPTDRSSLQRLAAYQDNIDFIREIVPVGTQLKGKAEHVLNSWKSVSKDYGKSCYDLKALRKFSHAFAKLESEYALLNEELFDHIAALTKKQKLVLVEKVSEKRCKISPLRAGSACIECGEPVSCFFYEIPVLPGKEIQRMSTKCFNCGSITDIPNQRPDVRIEGNAHLRISQDGLETELFRIVNGEPAAIDVKIEGIGIDTDLLPVQLSASQCSLQPEESLKVNGRFTPSGALLQGVYLFSFYLLIDQQFYYISKTVGYSRSEA